MLIGVPREIKTREFRVALTPAGVRALVEDGHQVLVERGAGLGSGIADADYRGAGAQLEEQAAAVFGRAELVVKVKEPLPPEYPLLRPGQLLFTYLHLAPLAELTGLLLERGVTAIAYETVQEGDGTLPLLQPMSEIAGRMAIQVGAHYLQKEQGGRGVLLAGATGAAPGRVLVLGAGTVGSNAVRIAVGIGAEVTVLNRGGARLAELAATYGDRIRTRPADPETIAAEVPQADLLVGAVLVVGGAAPRLVSRGLVERMREGSVIVDVAVDQGGCVETIRPTTHDAPVYAVAGVLHYGVANMPGAVSRTSTWALTDATLPYVRRLAAHGLAAAAQADPALARGVNTHAGRLCNEAVARAQGRSWQPYTPAA